MGSVLYGARLYACTWIGINPSNVATELPRRYEYADIVVHGEVVHVKQLPTPDLGSVAKIRVIESFKGANLQNEVRSRGACSHIFKLGDKGVFFIRGGEVQSGGVEPVSDWLIHALRERRSSQTPTPK